MIWLLLACLSPLSGTCTNDAQCADDASCLQGVCMGQSCARDADCGGGQECGSVLGTRTCVLACDPEGQVCPGETSCTRVPQDAAGQTATATYCL